MADENGVMLVSMHMHIHFEVFTCYDSVFQGPCTQPMWRPEELRCEQEGRTRSARRAPASPHGTRQKIIFLKKKKQKHEIWDPAKVLGRIRGGSAYDVMQNKRSRMSVKLKVNI